MQINERWIQFAFINSRGKLNKTAFKMPFHVDLEIGKEFQINIYGKNYSFSCEAREEHNNNDETIDVVYVVATNNS